uniref:Uncharacterized protein n=1 Tax=Anguilla anguilla TaxID=7936 RepID=A0A0E9SIB0_ANGAN
MHLLSCAQELLCCSRLPQTLHTTVC